MAKGANKSNDDNLSMGKLFGFKCFRAAKEEKVKKSIELNPNDRQPNQMHLKNNEHPSKEI